MAPAARTLRRNVARLLQRQAARFEELADPVVERLEEKAIHDLRVLTRRMRAAIWIGRHLSPPERLEELRRALRSIGHALGARRALDVTVNLALIYGLDAGRLARRRAQAGAQVRRALHPARREHLAQLLVQAAAGVGQGEDDRLRSGLRRRARRLERTWREDVETPAGLHALRIEAKKGRYLLEALGQKGDFLKKLQDHLGRGHDLQVLQEMLGPDPGAARDETLEGVLARQEMGSAVRRAVRRLKGGQKRMVVRMKA
jgi:CHAD domain-containing protein